MRALLAFVSVLLAIYLGLCALLFVRQRAMLYFPQPRSLPAEVASLELPVDDARLVITSDQREHNDALLYFGGNAEDVALNLQQLRDTFPEHALYLMHYRGYGGSEGSPTEAALKSDALHLYDHVQGQHRQVSVIGRSLGTGVALHVASRRPVQRLALVTPYDSLEAIAAQAYPIFPVRWLMLDKFRATDDAANLTIPTLLLLAERDRIIPRQSSERLHAAFDQAIVRMEVIAGVGHNTISNPPEYWQLLQDAIDTTEPETVP